MRMMVLFSHVCFQSDALEQITSCSFQELSWFLSSRCSRIILELSEGLISFSSYKKSGQNNPWASPFEPITPIRGHLRSLVARVFSVPPFWISRRPSGRGCKRDGLYGSSIGIGVGIARKSWHTLGVNRSDRSRNAESWFPFYKVQDGEDESLLVLYATD